VLLEEFRAFLQQGMISRFRIVEKLTFVPGNKVR
jgi:hypothetical protein